VTLTADPVFISGTDDELDLLDPTRITALSAAFTDTSGNPVDLAASDVILD
jgi:hypothetical protein